MIPSALGHRTETAHRLLRRSASPREAEFLPHAGWGRRLAFLCVQQPDQPAADDLLGLGGVGVVLGSQPYVERVTDMIPLPMLHTLVTVLALITIIDLAVTVAGMLEFERVLDSVSQVVQDVAARAGGTWQWGSSAVSDRMRELSQDTVERLRWAVNGVINAQQKRMLKSFPKFQVPDRQDIIDSLRELMGPRR